MFKIILTTWYIASWNIDAASNYEVFTYLK